MDTNSEVQKRLVELGPKSYSSVEIMSFTSNLLESNIIGFGGCGKVYKGQLPNGILIAVKVLENIDVVKDTFMAEVDTMGNARHLNLIKLYGYCFEDNMKALVYERMENGSLDKILYANPPINNIEWVKLYDIAIGVANGLKYLHHDLEEQIIHYDIKAANVLLGKNFSAKLADFGLAKTLKRDVSHVDGSTIRGTYGYIAPEILTPGSQVSSKCDVYSFGMMLFEILGKRNNGKEKDWFPVIVWNQFENGTLDQFLGDRGITEKDKKKAIILSKVALLCAHHIPERRPSMMDVVLMLTEKILVRQPSDPFPPGQFSNSSMVPSPEQFPQIFLEVPPARNERGQLDEMELRPTYPQSDGEQLKSNKHKTRSPNASDDDLATSVPKKGLKLPTTKLVGETTALNYKEIILQLIEKDEVVTIGVHGMGGVGKTSIIKHVHNHLLAEGKCFDKIIWVTISQDGNITKLQNDLAKELDLDLSREDDVLRRSRLLLQALEKKKRVVFFFDDMWNKISLEEIGISPELAQKNGFKLLLTTRKLEVCKRMGCHETITVEGLPTDEAWELFMNKVDCELTPKVRKIAEMVAKKCFGLPLAIITVGGAMKGNSDINDWTVALNDLTLKDISNRTMVMEDDVYECLKFSYDRLENEKQRKCFLCCALYPEDLEIETRDLVDFWIMDGLVEGTNTQNELVKGQCILNKLKDHCLLEYNKMYNKVKMHDSIREMALRLTNKSFMVQTGSGLEELPKEKEWEFGLERASFMDNMIKTISISPVCPQLFTLILGGHFLESVIHNFFVHMKCLKVLDLRDSSGDGFYNTRLELLPDSISDLANLRALRLSWYRNLKKLPSLAKLVSLRWLELNRIGIEELPEGMEMLVNLRRLNLHGVRLKKKIPMGLISKLTALEELYLGGIEIDKVYDIGSGECFTRELLSLKKLEILNVSLHCLSDYASYVGSSEFNGLKYLFLMIGEVFKDEHNQNVISFDNDKWYGDGYYLDQQFVHQNTNHIDMFGLLKKGVRELVQITIRGGNKIECIWSSKDENQEITATATGTSSCWLQSVERIYLKGYNKLYTIFEGIPNYTSGVLPVFCLKKLIISFCHDLKIVFPSSRMLQLLQNLEVITIEFCNELEELIRDDDEEETETPIAILPRLKHFKLCYLPKFKRIWRGVMICDFLKRIVISDCSELRRLPRITGKKVFSTCWPQSQEVIQIRGCSKLYTIFEEIPNHTSGILSVFCLKRLEISSCHNLQNVFPSSRMLQLLQNLEEITIWDCDELEELIGGDDEEEETETPIAIPRLKKLEIVYLPKLKRIWRGVMICDSLEWIKVDNCYKLKKFPQLKGEDQSTPPPALRRIIGGFKWWHSLEWDPAYPKYILQPFYFKS